jgi:hypothetical protein
MHARIHTLALLAATAAFTGAGCKGRSETAPAQDVGMATAGEVAIANVQLGKRLGPDKRVASPTSSFSPRDTIFASVETSGSAPNATINARWTYEGQQIVKEDTRTIAPSGTENTEFHISKPSGWPKGKYQFTVSLGGSTQSKDFEVK